MATDERTATTSIQSEDASDNERASLSRQPSDSSSMCQTEDEEDPRVLLGPKMSIRQHLEIDKDDESLRRWKEQLLGKVDASEEVQEPDVKILSLTILTADRRDLVLDIPESGNSNGLWFTLKEGSKYRLRFSIKVSNDIVCGLKYTNTIWKTGVKVDSSKEMLGTFSPQAEPYTHVMPEETTPSGYFARGSYTAKTKFVDDDKNCYLELNYTFDIRKEWPEI